MRIRGLIVAVVVLVGGAVALLAAALAPLSTLTAQTTTATATPPSLPGSGPVSVTYPSGWQIVGLPQGTILTGNNGPLYTFKSGDTAYEQIASGTPLTGGVGYWAFFTSPTTIQLAGSATATATATGTATSTSTSTATATGTSTSTATATATRTSTPTATATCVGQGEGEDSGSPGNSCAAHTCPFGTVADPNAHGECVSASAHQLNGTATATGTPGGSSGSTNQQPFSVHVGPGWTMVGNPFATSPARIGGAVSVAYAYNLPNTTGTGYQSVQVLPIGFGAIVFSPSGGTVTLTPVFPS